METNKLTQFKWFWAWEDEKEEAWLEAMSQSGWHLFKSLQEYLQICRDAGWEMLGRMSSWYYFRKEYRGGEKPEFFSDKDSKVQKYRRLLLFLVIFLPIMINGMLSLSRTNNSGFLSAVRIFYVLILLFFSYAIIRLLLRIKKLKKS
jgi:amino acid permease